MMRRFGSFFSLLALLAFVACSGGGAAAPGVPPGSAAGTAALQATAVDACLHPNAGLMNETWTLNGEALTIPLPPNPPWTGTIAFPANSPTGTVVSETDDQANFNYAPTSSPSDPRYGRRTKDLFMTFRVSQATSFGGGGEPLLPITLLSPCLISGKTYYIDAFAGSTFQYSEAAVASAGSVTVHIEVKPNPFPAGVYINAILSHE
ncbi:MAG TPA: hypothetical protein VHT05_05175 [Candidatus Elarobacter sp.]|nr:hypothetical protein [Candidatus Elarobacter sp.]